MKSACTLLLAALALALQADTPPSPYRYTLMTDGATIFPRGIVASTAEVGAATNQAARLSVAVEEQRTQVADLITRVETLSADVADLSKDGVWVLEGYINSIGLLSGTPEYDGTIEIVHLTVATNGDGSHHLTLYAAFDPAPVTASQVAMVGNASLGTDFADLTYTCSYPETVGNPKNPSDTRAVYTFEADYTAPAGFAKIVSVEGSATGVGDYLPVSGGLSINGINGATATVTADDGTVLLFKGGILVEAEPIAVE